MEILRQSLSLITVFLFLFPWYIWTGDYYGIQKSRNIAFSSMKIGIGISAIEILLTYVMYKRIDYILIVFSCFYIMLLLIRNKKEQIETFNYEAGNYVGGSNFGLQGVQLRSNAAIKTTIEGQERIIVFQTGMPDLNKNLILDCVKEEDVYLCRKYRYSEKKSFLQIVRQVFGFYVLCVAVYYISQMTTKYCNNILFDEEVHNGIIMTGAYCMFSSAYKHTKNGVNLLTKFMNKAYWVMMIFVSVLLLFIFY